ncbi:MAG: DUF485 domain-containing protein [Tepidisphaeraceae bacterium]
MPDDDDLHLVTRNARYGLVLFVVYVLLYSGFMALSAFWPERMAREYRGVNYAIWYGAGLIVAALALALVYMALCRSKSNRDGDAK